MKSLPILTTLAVALALAVGAATARAASTAADDARRAELEVARAELHRAAARVASLSRELGDNEGMVVEHRVLRGPVLGVVLEPAQGGGVRIAAITPESAATAAGLRVDDLLTGIDGEPLAGSDGDARLADARARLRRIEAGKPVTLAYLRDGRAAQVKVTPREGQKMLMFHDGDNLVSLHGAPQLNVGPDGDVVMEARMVRVTPAGVAPEIHREIIRLDGDATCAGGACRMPLLEEAFRWNGLNLASVDAKLGRYFGTDRGVLVLSLPAGMGGLQAGDVILELDGKEVTTPREAMVAAHAREPGTAMQVEYLRDRKRATTTVKLPQRPLLRMPAPPAPPAAPRAHAAPRAVPATAPPVPVTPRTAPVPMTAATPVAPPAPPAPPVPATPLQPAPDAPDAANPEPAPTQQP